MSRWSIPIGSLLGVPLFVHWTFLVLLGWLLAGPLMSGQKDALASGIRTTAFVLAIFGCIILHEMGHVLAARRYGIRTHDIILLPIGGVARLERLPENPVQELLVAVAGPAVNLAIAAVTIGALLLAGDRSALGNPVTAADFRVNFLASLGTTNLFLALFNFIPAFPMDGGRMLRAVLAMLMDRVTATRAAAIVGQALAVGFAVVGLFSGNVLLMLVALFVFMAAGAESQAEQFRSALRGVPAKAAMMRRFVSLRDSDTIARAAQELLAGSQQDFLVLAAGAPRDDDAAAIVGVVTRADLARALASGQADTLLSEVMRQPCRPVSEDDDLQAALASASTPADNSVPAPAGTASPEARADVERLDGACPVLAVTRPDAAIASGSRIVGLITSDNLMDLVMIRTAHTGRVR